MTNKATNMSPSHPLTNPLVSLSPHHRGAQSSTVELHRVEGKMVSTIKYLRT